MEDIMNKVYMNNTHESNCRFVKINDRGNNSTVLNALGELLCGLGSARVLNIIKVVFTLACFVGFIGVMGAVENGSISLGLGVVISAFMLFVEILCFTPKKRN